MDKLKLVKGIVFFMTFLLIFGSLLLLGSLYKKTRSTGASEYGEASLGQPAGSNIVQFNAEGGILYLLIKDGGKADRIIIFDSKNGRNLATVNVS